jgi:hypothetical protein
MNNLSQFSTKQNISLLWDVLLGELNINLDNKTLLSNIKTIFDSNLKIFISRVNPKIGLMELNKQYLSQVILAVQKLFPNLKQEQQIKRINISNEDVEEPYKIEDIHASRQNTFDKLVEKQKNDFDMLMNVQKPKEFDFSDKHSEEKIYAMDELLAEKLSQRNMELETLQNSNYNTFTNINPESWLKPKETSVKAEKTTQKLNNVSNITNNSNSNSNSNNKLKYINIDDNNSVSLLSNDYITDNKGQKKVSWNDNDNNISLHIQESIPNIFQKLKTIQPEDVGKGKNANRNKEENINIQENNNELYNKKYIEQPSTPLPDIKQEIIQRNIQTNSAQHPTTPQPSISSMISNSELIKQLNEMNVKIELLTDMVYKLVENKLVENKLDSSNNSNTDTDTDTDTVKPLVNVNNNNISHISNKKYYNKSAPDPEYDFDFNLDEYPIDC